MGRLSGYGHSWGPARVDSGELGFAAVAARALGITHDNRAHSGSLCTETALLVASKSAAARERFFVLITVWNDARLNGGAAQACVRMGEALEVVFRAFRQASPKALVLALSSRTSVTTQATHRSTEHRMGPSTPTTPPCEAPRPGISSPGSWPSKGWQQLNTMIATDGEHPAENHHGHPGYLAEAVVTAWSVVSRHTHRPGG